MLSVVALLLTVPMDLEAGRLEVHGAAWWADGGVAARQGGFALEAAAARGLVAEGCPDGLVRVLGPVAVTGGEARATATELEACLPAGPVVAQGLTVQAPRLQLAADRATWTDGRLTAQGVSTTACTCQPPPWRITATQADVTPGEGVWATWPVLWVGPVPVATAPRWYVPLARRRTGFLFPFMGFDGEDGAHARLPFFLTLGQSADLTVAPGWRQGWGVTTHGALRWAASEHETGEIAARAVLTEGVAVSGQGSLPLSGARLAIEGDATTHEGVRQALSPGLAARGRDHLRGTVAAGVAGARTGLGLRLVQLDDLVFRRSLTVAPDVWVRWHAAAGPAELSLHARTLTLVADGETRTLADTGLELDAVAWLGPVRLRPVVGGASTVHLDDGQGQTGAAWAAGEARVAAARRFGDLRHEVAVVLDARLAEAAAPAVGAFLPVDLPLASRSVGATLETRLAAGALAGVVSVRGGVEAEAPVEGVELPLFRAALEADAAHLDAGLAGDEAAWLRAGAQGEIVSVHAGFARLRPSADTPTLRRLGPQRPLALSTFTGDLATADGGLGLRLGPVELAYDAAVDVDAGQLLGQGGRLGYTSGCECWSARLGVGHEAGRDLPDAWLSLSVP
ncbi:MAG: LPS-assembly protein LptD [Myxococcales bacterium]|nr:LPS-assembly protein LptD [Myxococcales bacterium]